MTRLQRIPGIRDLIAEGSLYTNIIPNSDQGHKWIRNNHAGIILSRLYIGSWNLDNYEQDFRLKFNKKSWVDIHILRQYSSAFINKKEIKSNWRLLSIQW